MTVRSLSALLVCCIASFGANVIADEACCTLPLQTPKLFVTLNDAYPTPDGMAIAPDGKLVVACPNYAEYGNAAKPACLLKIDASGNVEKWFNVPTLPETGVACPMGIEFGAGGEVFICDNQGWKGTPEGAFKGRILGCKVEGAGDDAEVTTRVIADGIEHPNGIRYHGGKLYVTNSLMTKIKDRSGLLVSGVYCFDPNAKQTVHVTNTRRDRTLIFTCLTYNKDCQYGLDGIAFDKNGALYLGNFGDGSVLKLTFDRRGRVASSKVWAKDPQNLRTTDGICFDDAGNLYIADFSENAVAVVTPDAKVFRIAKSPDSDGANGELDQPGEPIVWNGRVIVTCFDCVTGPDKVNTKHDASHTITSLPIFDRSQVSACSP
ncbi:MAG: SMP-30/gluconolactonase/LRE family protein [Thermoguttaceae bacterium]